MNPNLIGNLFNVWENDEQKYIGDQIFIQGLIKPDVQQQIKKEIDKAFSKFNGNLDAYSKTIEKNPLKKELLKEFKRRMNDQELTQKQPSGWLTDLINERKDKGERHRANFDKRR